jgi:hypothetical protein
MNVIPEATATIFWRQRSALSLKGLARWSKMEHRRRKRARIVLLAAEGMVPDPRAISKGDARHISSGSDRRTPVATN